MKTDINSNLVWVDLEMTGVNPSIHNIVEISVVVTDNNLNILDEIPSIVIHQESDVLDKMDNFARELHTTSGLIKEVEKSDVSLQDAQAEVLKFLEKHCKPQKAPLCGNSIWVDRMFLRAYMPKVESFLNYRVIDVSSVKEIAARWYGEKFEKKNAHRAYDDIIESIEELKFYRNSIFKNY